MVELDTVLVIKRTVVAGLAVAAAMGQSTARRRASALPLACAAVLALAAAPVAPTSASASLAAAAAAAAAPPGPREVGVEDWDEFRTKVIANYASATYCEIEFLEDWSCARCNDGFKLLDARLDGDLQWLIGLDGYLNAVVVAFRGTIYNSIANWMRDMHFNTQRALRVFPDASLPANATVHKGFANAYGSLRESVNAAVLDAVKQTDLVIVSGHSMGGAVATMAAAEFVSSLSLDNVWLYTFGSPRTGDYAFTQARPSRPPGAPPTGARPRLAAA